MYLQLGVTEVRCAGAARALNRTGGGLGRSVAGKLGASLTVARKREWDFATVPLPLADGEALIAMLDGSTYLATGDFAPDPSGVQVVGEFGGAEYLQLADGMHVAIRFALREV